MSPGMVRIQGSTANIKATLPKSPKRISLNVNHDILAAEVTVKKRVLSIVAGIGASCFLFSLSR